MSYLCQRRNVADIPRWIAYTLAEYRSRFLVNRCVHSRRMIGFREPNVDAEAWENVGEQGVRSPVELWDRDNIRAGCGKVKYRVVQRCLTRAYAERFQSTFQRRDPPLQNDIGGIADPAIPVTFSFEVEKRSAMIGAVKSVRYSLVDRDRNGFRGAVRFIARMDGQRFASHLPPFGITGLWRANCFPQRRARTVGVLITQVN